MELRSELAAIRDGFSPEEKHNFLTETLEYNFRWETQSTQLGQSVRGALFTGTSVEKAYPVYFIPARGGEFCLTRAAGHGRDSLQNIEGISNDEALAIFHDVLVPQVARTVDHGSISDALVDNIGRRM